MKIVGAITIYSSDPNSAQLLATVAQLRASGLFVTVRPLSERKRYIKHRARISPDLVGTLTAIQQN
jgi:hypothetical protein